MVWLELSCIASVALTLAFTAAQTTPVIVLMPEIKNDLTLGDLAYVLLSISGAVHAAWAPLATRLTTLGAFYNNMHKSLDETSIGY